MAVRKCSKQYIYRLIKNGKLESRATAEGTLVWLDDNPVLDSLPYEGEETRSGGGVKEVNIPVISQSRVTDELLRKIDGMLRSIAASGDIVATEMDVEANYDINARIQRIYKGELRTLFGVPSRGSIDQLIYHPQIRQALEYVIARKGRSDKLTMRAAKGLCIVKRATGEMVSIEEHLISLYARENVNADACYEALKGLCLKRLVVKADGSPAMLADLPAESTVTRWLRDIRTKGNRAAAIKMGRMRKNDFAANELAYVTRDPETYAPGEMWVGDHTELDFLVINEKGEPDRRWMTAFVDFNTQLLVGYHLSWMPNSQTIALAFRAGVTGSQLKAKKAAAESEESLGEFVPVNSVNVPAHITVDNGKDYKSKATGRLIGKINFDDDSRRSVQRITHLHYCLPYHGMSKAVMERWWGIFQQMIKYLPGYKGNHYQNKPDTLAKDIKQNALLTVEEFDAIVAVAVNSYNNRENSRHQGTSPLVHYLTNLPSQRTIDIRVLDFLMIHAKPKTIRRCQVEFPFGEYYSDALLKHNGKRADVYYDPNDLGFVSLYVDGEFAAVACNKALIGKSERGNLSIVAERRATEKQLRDQLAAIHGGLTDREAWMQLLEGQLLNTMDVDESLILKQRPTIVLMTGIESDAAQTMDKIEQEKELVEIEKQREKRNRNRSWTADDVANVS
jgi:transposase InsO family protein